MDFDIYDFLLSRGVKQDVISRMRDDKNMGNPMELDKFIVDTDEWIDDVLASVGWTRDHVLQSTDLIQCPINQGHFVSPKSSEEHMKFCTLAAKGYSKEEVEADQSSKFFYEKAPSVVSVDLDESVLHDILANAEGTLPAELPATMRRAMITLSAAQRLHIYEYCIQTARAQNAKAFVDEDFMLLEDKADSSDKPQSTLEILAKQRDMKRRRQSYRGKNTHTNKKNHTEVIRDVLNNQMEILASIWAEEAKHKEGKEQRDAGEQNEFADGKCRRRSTSTHRDSSHTEQQDDDVSSKRIKDRDRDSPQHVPDRSRHNERQDDDKLDQVKNRRDDRHRDDRRYFKQERDDRYSDRPGRNDRRHRTERRERDGDTEEDDRYDRRHERSQKGSEERPRYKRQRFDEDESSKKYDRRHRHDDDARLSPVRKERIVRSVINVPSVTSESSRNVQTIKRELDTVEMKRELCDD